MTMYIPSFIRSSLEGNKALQLTFSQVSDTNILSTSSFNYDSLNTPLKSTQQLNLDWSKFENHTFFMSAEAKVNIAFDQIINSFPFDGTKSEFESFFENLTGFENWIYTQFPKYKGQLHFSGSALSETSSNYGTYIVVKDIAGSLYPDISKNKSGESILNPKEKSISFEFDIKIPNISTDGSQVIFQKLNGEKDGIAFFISPTVSTTTVDATFCVLSGSDALSVTHTLEKGIFNHICLTLDKDSSDHYLTFYCNNELAKKTQSIINIGTIDFDKNDFIIGSGSSFYINSTYIMPQQTLSGTLDEFRVFHSTRSKKQQQLFSTKNIYANEDLKLYFKFNEPGPPLMANVNDVANSIVIDSSGNSLHSLISNFYSYVDYDISGNLISNLRQDASLDETSKMINEKLSNNPVLFPAYTDTVNLNESLVFSATNYDIANPNLITKLVPKHYLLDGNLYEGIQNPDSETLNLYSQNGLPKEGKLNNVQLLVSMLYIWAKFFDEIKLIVDSFSSVRTVVYDKNKSMPNNFLLDFVKYYGIYLPPLFNRASLEQYANGENIKDDISSSETTIRYVQNELLRRVLINIPDVIRSKGTQHSIKAFLRSVGIDPENSIRLKEYGGPTERSLEYSREQKSNIAPFVQFLTSSFLQTKFLSGSRVEPGYPEISGQFINSISNNLNDGLYTSGSWTVEKNIKYSKFSTDSMTSAYQSISRIYTTGSAVSGGKALISNVVATSASLSSTIDLYLRPGSLSSSPILHLSLALSGAGIFDGDIWNISYGCHRNDEINSNISSSYFLRVGKQLFGEINETYQTSSFFYEINSSESNVFREVSNVNSSGSFIAIGENDYFTSSSINVFLNDENLDLKTKTLACSAMINNIKFWSKYISDAEWKEHVLNYDSVGVNNPIINYNFNKTISGSFEKLRMLVVGKQSNKTVDNSGAITLFDLSQNNNHAIATGFEKNKSIYSNSTVNYSYISPYFDEATTNEKIRIRSLKSQNSLDINPWIKQAPIYELQKNEEPIDDPRFSIEFSLIDALNKDIITMFSSLDEVNNFIGNPEIQFSENYQMLNALRDNYFNKISDKLNFKAFFDFYKWFDMSIGTFIEQLIPRKTKFKGTNFVIQSHMLERNKAEYKHFDIYMSPNSRKDIRDNLFVQFVEGGIKSR